MIYIRHLTFNNHPQEKEKGKTERRTYNKWIKKKENTSSLPNAHLNSLVSSLLVFLGHLDKIWGKSPLHSMSGYLSYDPISAVCPPWPTPPPCPPSPPCIPCPPCPPGPPYPACSSPPSSILLLYGGCRILSFLMLDLSLKTKNQRCLI